MDRVTHSVRAFYEAYPYPPGDRVDCDGYQVRLLLSYLEHSPETQRPLQVLEAGCGRGLNLLAAAAAQPDIQFLGLDISRVAIQEASQAAEKRGLTNLTFQLADLMQPATLPTASDGFDLILSYGVLHHLKDPAQGLAQLRQLLSPQGIIAFMVDGQFGRQPLDRFLQALTLLDGDGQSEQQREERARALARVAEKGLFAATHWQGTAEVNAVEFADRCLHVQEQSYTIDSLWALLQAAGLSFLRWLEPADWQLSALQTEAVLDAGIERLTPVDRYRLVERLCQRPKLTLMAAPLGAEPRAELASGSVGQARFRINPQLKSLQQEGQQLWQLRSQSPRAAENALAEAVLLHALSQAEDFNAASLRTALTEPDCESSELEACLLHLHAAEWLYRPHRSIEGEAA